MADTNIKTQISRLSGAKTDLAAAITAKGVTVPDTTTLDGYAALVEQIDTGVDTSDADATAADIARGKTAYVNGEKVTGDVFAITTGTSYAAKPFSKTSTALYAEGTVSSGQDLLFRAGSWLQCGINSEYIGDAAASDVAKGKTFTSAAGWKVTGTAESGTDTSDATATAADIAEGKTAYVNGVKLTGTAAASTNNIEAYHITSADDAVSFNTTDGTVKAWGYGTVTTQSSYYSSTTVLAFCGDTYYKSASWGSPTSASLSLSISGGKVSGLPTMNSCDLLITMGI